MTVAQGLWQVQILSEVLADQWNDLSDHSTEAAALQSVDRYQVTHPGREYRILRFVVAEIIDPDIRRRPRPTDLEYRIALRTDPAGADPLAHGTPLDDIVVNDVEMFRAEDMGDSWWVCCYLADAERICWTVASDGRWTVTEYPATDEVAYEHVVAARRQGDDG